MESREDKHPSGIAALGHFICNRSLHLRTGARHLWVSLL